jgi:DNA-binding response OmpR family regulator
LIIEDDRDLAEVLEYSLRRQGHEVCSTTDGREGIRLLDLLEPDLVVTDIIMPDADTFDLITALRRSRPEIKIVAISGNAHLLTLAASHGVDQVLPKPFDIRDLNAVVKGLLK